MTNLAMQQMSLELKANEEIIKRGWGTVLEVGRALQRIRDNKLYRIMHSTFEGYCRETFSMSRSYAYRVIDAAAYIEEKTNEMSPNGDKVNGDSTIPTTEGQARAQKKAKKKAKKKAEKVVQQPTARQVEQAVQEVRAASQDDPWEEPLKGKSYEQLSAMSAGFVKDFMASEYGEWYKHAQNLMEAIHHYCELPPISGKELACAILQYENGRKEADKIGSENLLRWNLQLVMNVLRTFCEARSEVERILCQDKDSLVQ